MTLWPSRKLVSAHAEICLTIDYKHLKGGIEFLDVVPKSPSGKILRRLLRDQEKKKRAQAKAKL